MSTSTPTLPKHRFNRSTALPTSVETSQAPSKPYHFKEHRTVSDNTNEMDKSQQPTTPPRTPQKTNRNNATAVKSQLSGSESVSKPRSKAKNRNKNSLTSPAASRNDRRTPPLSVLQSGITSAKPYSTPSATAYAGPTFHASPAPSTLPIPSFFAKPVPNSPDIKGLQSEKEDTSSGGDESPTPPVAKLVLPQPEREESPLDFFFKADREEKARARSASSSHTRGTESGPFVPPQNSARVGHNTPPNSQDRIRPAHFSGGSSSALLAMELDGAGITSKPYGPAFSTPYHERINAARPTPASAELTQEQPKATENSEALKLFLFSPLTQSPPVSRLVRSEEMRGVPTSQPASESVLRSVPNHPVSQRGSGNSPWSSHNSLSHLSNSGASRGSPRAGPRSSGLRQEFIATKTTAPPSEQADLSEGASSVFRGPKYQQQVASAYAAKNSSSASAPLQASVPPSGMKSGGQPIGVKEMEDTLRRILKLEPVGNSFA